MSRTLFMFMSVMKFWKNISNFPVILRIIFWKKIPKKIETNFFLLAVAHLANGAPLVSLNFFHFSPLDLKSPVSFVLLGFWGFSKSSTRFPRLNSDITFRVDDFSYKKLFNPSSYAKLIAILQISREILQIKSKFIFVNFPNN